MRDYSRALDIFFVEPPEVQRRALDKILDRYARTKRDLLIAVLVCAALGLLLLVLSFKYLRTVDAPQPKCLRPVLVPTQIELAAPHHDVEVWL